MIANPPSVQCGSTFAANSEPTSVPSIFGAILHHAAARPDHTALVNVSPSGDPTAGITYAQLASSLHDLQARYMSFAAPGAVILLLAANDASLATWMLAGLVLGWRILPVHPDAPAGEVATLAAHAGAIGAIAITTCPRAPAHLPRITLDDALASATRPRDSSVPRPNGGVVLPTSGTTGRSKLAFRNDAALLADARQASQAMRLTPADRVAAVIPLCHSYGVDMLVATMLAGSTLHIFQRFDSAGLATHLMNHATVFPGVPFMFDALSRFSSRDHRTLRLAFSAGTSLPARVQHAFHNSWNLRIGQLYGATEMGTVTFNDPADEDFDPDSVGPAIEGVTIRILHPDDDTRVVPSGEEGQVVIAASLLSEYLPGEAPALIDGFFPTGDLGRVDPRGRLFITGRLKHLIDVGGLKVNPLDVETALATHPEVAECAVVPMPISDTVDRLRALFVPRDPHQPPTAAELRSFLKTRVAAYKVPRVFEPVSSLPRGPTGKLLRRQLNNIASIPPADPRA